MRDVGVDVSDSNCGGCMKSILKSGCLVVMMLALAASVSGETWYVKTGAPGAEGTPWADAFTDLQPALDAAEQSEGDDTIWVAEGTYYPSNTHDLDVEGAVDADRYMHFRLQKGVTLLGGFAGTETSADQRDVSAHETILSGDIGTADDISDNCYHVFYHSDSSELDDTAVLDGFTVTGGNADSDVYPHDGGGGMENLSFSSPTLRQCTFTNNQAKFGGGIFNRNSSSPAITQCTFSQNDANYGGGAVMNYSESSPAFTDCTFSMNVSLDGAGMENDKQSHPILVNCLFTGNTAGNVGGGMCNYDNASPTLTHCRFISNTADSGGGIFDEKQSSPTMTDCLFRENIAVYTGGGIDNYDHSSPTLIDCTFTSNTAENGGGVFNWSGSSPVLSGCLFSVNSVDDNGGGMFSGDNSKPSLVNVTFESNSADYGGGMYNYDDSGARVKACVFAGNSASSDGGGSYNENSSPSFINCIFSKNTSIGGGAVFNWNASPVFTNCILWGNTAETRAEIYSEDTESDPLISYCTIEGSGGSDGWTDVMGKDGGHNLDLDPMFEDPENNDFHLKAGSPCIDSGNNAALPEDVTTDTDGEDRVFDGDFDGTPTVDMGVDEVVDSDSDGFSDYGETMLYPTDPDDEDTDDDGIPDGFEWLLWGLDWDSDPDGDTLINLLDPDSDGDGVLDGAEDNDNDTMPNGWEVQNNLDPGNPDDGDLDPDEDGLSNKAEYARGLDPNVNEEPRVVINVSKPDAIEGDEVTLDASPSFDPDESIISYHWEPDNYFLHPNQAKVTFYAPEASIDGDTYTFELTVTTPSGQMVTETCVVNVSQYPSDDGGSGRGCFINTLR